MVKPRRAAGKKGCFRPLDSASGPPTFFKQVAWHQPGVPAWASAQRCISTGLISCPPGRLRRPVGPLLDLPVSYLACLKYALVYGETPPRSGEKRMLPSPDSASGPPIFFCRVGRHSPEVHQHRACARRSVASWPRLSWAFGGRAGGGGCVGLFLFFCGSGMLRCTTWYGLRVMCTISTLPLIFSLTCKASRIALYSGFKFVRVNHGRRSTFLSQFVSRQGFLCCHAQIGPPCN